MSRDVPPCLFCPLLQKARYSQAGSGPLGAACAKMCHLQCLDPPLAHIPEGDWFCPGCLRAAEFARTPSAADNEREAQKAADTSLLRCNAQAQGSPGSTASLPKEEPADVARMAGEAAGANDARAAAGTLLGLSAAGTAREAAGAETTDASDVLMKSLQALPGTLACVQVHE